MTQPTYSGPEAPAQTEAQQILARLDDLTGRLGTHANALNAIGENLQWLVDNVKNVFQTFQNPAFMNALMSGQMPGMPNPTGAMPGTPSPNESGVPGTTGSTAPPATETTPNA